MNLTINDLTAKDTDLVDRFFAGTVSANEIADNIQVDVSQEDGASLVSIDDQSNKWYHFRNHGNETVVRMFIYDDDAAQDAMSTTAAIADYATKIAGLTTRFRKVSCDVGEEPLD